MDTIYYRYMCNELENTYFLLNGCVYNDSCGQVIARSSTKFVVAENIICIQTVALYSQPDSLSDPQLGAASSHFLIFLPTKAGFNLFAYSYFSELITFTTYNTKQSKLNIIKHETGQYY